MSRLFASEDFDRFSVEEAVIKTCLTYNIDGLYEKSYFDGEDPLSGEELSDAFTPWKLLRPRCTELIKGKNTPVFMKFIFHGSAADFPDLRSDKNIKALLIMLKYERTGLTLTTGISQNTFLPGHDTEKIWDSRIREFMSGCGAEYEEL